MGTRRARERRFVPRGETRSANPPFAMHNQPKRLKSAVYFRRVQEKRTFRPRKMNRRRRVGRRWVVIKEGRNGGLVRRVWTRRTRVECFERLVCGCETPKGRIKGSGTST